jgi:glc operon protein GlcG
MTVSMTKESRMKFINTFVVAITLAFASLASAQTIDKKAMTLEAAKKVIAAAVAEAKIKNAPGGAIAVVDEGGNLVAVERLDNTFAAGANISIGKARTSALFKRPTKAFEDIINKGRRQRRIPPAGRRTVMIDGQVIRPSASAQRSKMKN